MQYHDADETDRERSTQGGPRDDHDRQHAAERPASVLDSVLHHHHHDSSIDNRLEATAQGIRALWLSLSLLFLTALVQLAIALASGSVSLLADTIHNFSDALTALPLWLAFLVGRRPANRRYTYGYGRAEDVAGLAVVLVIVVSAAVVLWESFQRIAEPAPLHRAGWVAAAAVVGVLGNEGVALIRLRAGRRIGSAALEADGHHARVDGLSSLGVLVAAVAVVLGVPVADPIVGLLISIVILLVTRDAAIAVWHRLMDAVDPRLVERAEDAAGSTPGVLEVTRIRLRWLGHRLVAEAHLTVAADLSLNQAHAIAADARHQIQHALPRIGDVSISLEPLDAARDHLIR